METVGKLLQMENTHALHCIVFRTRDGVIIMTTREHFEDTSKEDTQHRIHVAENIRAVQIFVFFEGRAVLTQKFKLGETLTHWYFTCKACGWCGFFALKTRILKFSSEGLSSHSTKIVAPSKMSRYMV